MLLNPLFGLIGDAPPSGEALPTTEAIDGRPFQEILSGVHQATEGSQSNSSVYPSLAQVIVEAIAAEGQGSSGSTQQPGLERVTSDHPQEGSTSFGHTNPQGPIEPGLTNGVTRVSPREELSPAVMGSPLDLDVEADPAVRTEPTQTELSFGGQTPESDDGHASPNLQHQQLPRNHTPAPQERTTTNIDKSVAPPLEEGRDDSEILQTVRGQDRTDQPTRTERDPHVAFTPNQNGSISRDEAQNLNVWGETLRSQNHSEGTEQPPDQGGRTNAPVTGQDALLGRAPSLETGNGVHPNQDAPVAEGQHLESPPHQQPTLFEWEAVRLSDQATSVFRSDQPTPEAALAEAEGTERIGDDAAGVMDQRQSVTIDRDGQAARAGQETRDTALPPAPAARIEAALSDLESPRLARDVATVVASQRVNTNNGETGQNVRVAELLRSMDGGSEPVEGIRRLPTANTPNASQPKASVEAAQPRTIPGSVSGELGRISAPATDAAPSPERLPVADGPRQDWTSHVTLDDGATDDLAEHVARTETREARRPLLGHQVEEEVEILRSVERSVSQDQRSVSLDRTPSPTARVVQHEGGSDAPLQDLLPTNRPEAQVIGTSPTAAPESAIPTIGAVSGSHESIPSMEPVTDQPTTAPTDVEETKVTQRIVRGARFLTREGANQVTLRLDPPELGEITIRLSSVDKTLTGEIRVESRMVQEIVNRNMAELRESLGSQGIQIDNIEVSVESGNRSGVDREGSSAFRREQTNQDGRPTSDRDRRPEDREDTPDRPPRDPQSDGDIDLIA